MTSIVIPVYNMAEFVGQAIESALSQTVPCEIIVVNDGSTDTSQEVIEKYPVKVIEQVNKGLASARNTGIMNATGDYILFLDADDILQENCVERMKQVIAETGADVVAPSFKTFGLASELCILQTNPTVNDFKQGNKIGYCAAVKREVLLECGGYNPRMTWGYEDYHLWFDLLSREKTIVTIPEVLWLYRVRENSMIATAQAHHEELMTTINNDFPQLAYV